MRKTLLPLLLWIIFLHFDMKGQTSTAPISGDGSEDNPYQIATLENLCWLSENSAVWDSSFIQTADIDASETVDWNDGEGFSPIGNKEVKFEGKYDGAGFLIDNLFINRPDDNYVGLFGYTLCTNINGIGVVNCTVTGKNYVGGLVGYNISNSVVSHCFCIGDFTCSTYGVGGLIGYNSGSEVYQCYSGGTVNGNYWVGGLIGSCRSSATVYNCYSSASVIGEFAIGGLIGYNSESLSITNCYSVGNVLGDDYAGAFVGKNYSSIVSDCYYNKETSGQDSGVGKGSTVKDVTALSTTQMKQNLIFSDWDFNDTWEMEEGLTFPCLQGIKDAPIILSNLNKQWSIDEEYNDTINVVRMDADYLISLTQYPSTMVMEQDSIIKWTPSQAGDFTVKVNTTDKNGLSSNYEYTINIYLFSGEGTEEDPFLIKSLADLDSLSNNRDYWDKYFLQTVDIDASDTENWNDGSGFSSIGKNTKKFTGSYDGGNHNITNLFINCPSNSDIGLFGSIKNSHISDLNLVNASIVGYDESGCLVGSCYSSEISNCNISGSFDGNNYAALLSGYVVSSSIVNCSANGSVNGRQMVGGIAGYLSSSEISDCNCLANIEGTYYYVGGLVGLNNKSSINQCYYRGSVKGSSNYTGGFVGLNRSSATITNCYSTGTVSGYYTTGGFVGQNKTSSIISKCYCASIVSAGYNVPGSFAGNNSSDITDCYYNVMLSDTLEAIASDSNSQEVNGLTNIQMKESSMFQNWDFNEVWDMEENITYPHLNTVDDYPLIIQNIPKVVHIDKEVLDTIYIIQMDAEIASVEILAKPANMQINDDSLLIWTPNILGDTILSIKVTDVNGLETICTYNLRVKLQGSGTANDPYLVRNLDDLKFLSEYDDYWSCYFLQTANIDASITYQWEGNEGFSPIGNSSTKFKGNYNGNGYVIDSLYINRTSEDNIGLFGYTINAEISNVNITNASVAANSKVGALLGENFTSILSGCYSSGAVTGNENVGGLVGYIDTGSILKSNSQTTIMGTSYVGGVVGTLDASVITDSYSSGIVSGSVQIGGLVGYSWASSSIDSCYSNAIVSGNNCVGGLVGECYAEASVAHCYSNATVAGGSKVGGLVGFNNNEIKVSTSYNEGSVSGTSYIGGLVGYNNDESYIFNCYNVGTVSGTSYIGGLSGGNYSLSEIYLCYNAGFITGYSYVGGLVGYNKTFSVSDGYNIGPVTGDVNSATIVGYNYKPNASAGSYYSLVKFCYYNTETSNDTVVVGHDESNETVFGLPTELMTHSSNLDGLDFEEKWGIREDSTYAALSAVDNAPFAFADTLTGSYTALSHLLDNDYDYETLQENLIYRIDSAAIAGGDDGYLNDLSSFENGDSIKILYRAGEIREEYGDTLWGNYAVSYLKISNTVPDTNQQLELAEDDSLSFSLGNLVTDEEGDSLTFSILSTVKNGELTVLDDEYSYNPNANFNGKDSIQIEVNDQLGMATFWIVFNVQAVNDAPVLTSVDEGLTMEENSSFIINMDNITANDDDGDELSLVIVEGDNYSVSGLSIVPNTDFYGVLDVPVYVTDGLLNSDTLTMSVYVNSIAVDPVITWEDPDAITYGTALSETQLNASADAVGTFTYDPSEGTVLKAGNHILSVEFIPNDKESYNSITATSAIVVTKAIITATAEDQIVDYGSDIPELTIRYSGFVNEDTKDLLDILPETETKATTESDAGIYSITVSGGSDDNYDFDYVSGTLTITVSTSVQKVLTDNIKVYPNPASLLIRVEGASGIAELYNLVGEKMFTQDLSKGNSIDVSDMPKGIYILLIKNSSGKKCFKQKIVKE